ncbi:tartrate dehydrogenase [Salinicoccus sediminis]|uniref:D-malate dehydrogenase (decarboxylating) n=1 Tax=Salinicoccus sediminis TaxID=1432562 RepID=A0A0M2SN12_9STAP|nr:tartrate dehydrogenase [Salinicoccus sediminis]KKK35066.1 tartrate dehydrogenase [Salinicoccus sediminis]
MKNIKLAVIPGDGIGKEVVPASLKVLDTIADIHGGMKFEYEQFEYGCDYYLKHGSMMAPDGMERLGQSDSVFLGAVGDASKVPDHISLWGLLLKIRREFELEINVRPAKVFSGIRSPLVNPKDFDIMVVRENSEGEYSSVGGRMYQGDDEIAIQNNVFSKRATKQAMEHAFRLAGVRRGHVTSATKSNGIFHSMPFWDEVFKETAAGFEGIETASRHIDALAASFVTHPERYDVVVASNLFGDILTDVGAAIMGSIGIAPSANLNLNGRHPSMFEPVHGSAPDIVGRGIANPIGQIWTAKMLLDHHGEEEMGRLLLETMESVTADGFLTPDVGGTNTMDEVTEQIIGRLKR